MIKLKLTAKDKEQELILAYLQENVSEILAEKINNGVSIVKEGKHLISKKTLDGFMRFAAEEARKLAAKGAKAACVEDATVFGWAIHFFEESSIEGTLYNEDGSEYKPIVKINPKATVKPALASSPKKKENPQMSLFGLLETKNDPTMPEDGTAENGDELNIEDGLDVEDEQEEVPQPQETPRETTPKSQVPEFYRHYLQLEQKYSDGIILCRLGDFYEAFGKSAIKISEEFDLTLTNRNVGRPERVPMSGLPYHAVDVYSSKLVERGYKVIKVDRMGEAVLERRRTLEIIADEETGEVLFETSQNNADGLYELDLSAFDQDALAILDELFGNEIELR